LSLDPRILKRLLNFRLVLEGPSSWAFRELVDLILDFFEERFSLILNEALEPYGLEASVLRESGCRILPRDPHCSEYLVAGVYEKDSPKPLAYALYYFNKGENTLEIRLQCIVDAQTMERICE